MQSISQPQHRHGTRLGRRLGRAARACRDFLAHCVELRGGGSQTLFEHSQPDVLLSHCSAAACGGAVTG